MGHYRHSHILSRRARFHCVALILATATSVSGCATASSDQARLGPLATEPAPKHTMITATDGAAGDTFGGARWYNTFVEPLEPAYYATPGETALSSDGTVAVVGAPGAPAGEHVGAGAAYVYAKRKGAWSQVTKLTADDATPHSALGWTVAISGDGREILAGAPYTDSFVGEDSGAAYVFRSASGRWSQAAKLLPKPERAYDEFGWSVSIARRGNFVAVGAPGRASATAANTGATFVLRRGASPSDWQETAEFTAPSPRSNGQFGSAVELNADGSKLVATEQTHRDPDQVMHTGTTALFATTDGWESATELANFDDSKRNADGESTAYGVDVTISDDGSVFAVAVPDLNVGKAVGAGSAVVYSSTCRWREPKCAASVQLISRHPQPYQYFGSALALNARGTRLFLGNDGGGTNGQGEGELVVLNRSRSGAVRLGPRRTFAAPNLRKGRFGTAVAVSASGAVGIASAPWLAVNGEIEQGAAYIVEFTKKPNR